MANFRATIKGTRGQASRLGSKNSGIKAHVNGWDVGIDVCASVNTDGQDEFRVYLTGGSNDAGTPVCVGTYTVNDFRHAQPIKAV